MAGTIIGNVAIGASDYTSWISAMEKTRKGFLAVSLTNFATTAASLIGTGSVMELAGSFYTFTETSISLASGTASASVAVYFTVIPSGGGTTSTVVMDSTVPVWSDAKQGFYASAASLTRYIGGCYIGTAATYYGKFLYTGQYLDYCLSHGKTRPLLTKIVEIGEWNMDATESVTIDVGIPCVNVRRLSVTIINDNLNNYHDFVGSQNVGSAEVFLMVLRAMAGNNVQISRDTDGYFDTATFNGTASTVANRGFIIIEYES